MIKTFRSVNLDVETADKFGEFLKAENIYYERSYYSKELRHFEVLVNKVEEATCNEWLENN